MGKSEDTSSNKTIRITTNMNTATYIALQELLQNGAAMKNNVPGAVYLDPRYAVLNLLNRAYIQNPYYLNATRKEHELAAALSLLSAAKNNSVLQKLPVSEINQNVGNRNGEVKNVIKRKRDGGRHRIYIDQPTDLDVLCGRGGRSNHHTGNKRYRQVISDMKMTYKNTDKKLQKTDLSCTVVDHVCKYGGRFVKKEEDSGRYFLLTRAEARRKTSQALRENKDIKWT